MEKKRSIGVTIFAIIFLVLGLGGIRNMILFFPRFHITWLQWCKAILYSIFLLTSSMGIFMLKEWGRKLTLFFGSFWIARAIFYGVRAAYKMNQTMNFLDCLLVVLTFLIFAGIPIFVLCWYLTRPKVKEQFK